MSLDITILNDDGSPSEEASLSVEEHWKIVQGAKPPARFPLISRLKDYYEDAEYAPWEISALQEEFKLLHIKECDKCIRIIITLCDKAMARRK